MKLCVRRVKADECEGGIVCPCGPDRACSKDVPDRLCKLKKAVIKIHAQGSEVGLIPETESLSDS